MGKIELKKMDMIRVSVCVRDTDREREREERLNLIDLCCLVQVFFFLFVVVLWSCILHLSFDYYVHNKKLSRGENNVGRYIYILMYVFI